MSTLLVKESVSDAIAAMLDSQFGCGHGALRAIIGG